MGDQDWTAVTLSKTAKPKSSGMSAHALAQVFSLVRLSCVHIAKCYTQTDMFSIVIVIYRQKQLEL